MTIEKAVSESLLLFFAETAIFVGKLEFLLVFLRCLLFE